MSSQTMTKARAVMQPMATAAYLVSFLISLTALGNQAQLHGHYTAPVCWLQCHNEHLVNIFHRPHVIGQRCGELPSHQASCTPLHKVCGWLIEVMGECPRKKCNLEFVSQIWQRKPCLAEAPAIIFYKFSDIVKYTLWRPVSWQFVQWWRSRGRRWIHCLANMGSVCLTGDAM